MTKSMRLILDTNEYIFGLDPSQGKEAPIRLLDSIHQLLQQSMDFALLVPEVVREEVQRNLPPRFIGDFYRYITADPRIVYGSLYDVPPAIFERYHRELELKTADAVIAAFADWAKADFLVSENRHIYRELKVNQFITCNADEFVTLLESDRIWQVVDELRKRRAKGQG